MNLDELTDAVWKRLQQEKPRALLIGREPDWSSPYQWVREAPYDAVVLGLLSPGELLQMPTDPVCQALLEEKPVYLWPRQPYRAFHTAKMLCRQLSAQELRLKQLGVEPLTEQGRLLTASEVRRMQREGIPIPETSRMTPLAREIAEGKSL